MIGEIVGPYRIVASLGSGGMGVVWKAIDARLNRPVAIKAIRDTDAESTDAILRLRAEALAAASLDHPYICKIYELLETATATLVVMEFVEGETLEDILTRQIPALGDGFMATARLDEQRGRLFVTRAVEGIHNIHVLTLENGKVRALTSNQSPGVSFSGILPLESDAIIFAREERKADIWLVRRK